MYNVMSHKPGWCKFAASGSCLMSTINGRFPKLPLPTIVRIRDKPGSENLGLGSRVHLPLVGAEHCKLNPPAGL
jgi:hypothetical protein